MNRAAMFTNKLCYQREVDRNKKMHARRLKNMKSTSKTNSRRRPPQPSRHPYKRARHLRPCRRPCRLKRQNWPLSRTPRLHRKPTQQVPLNRKKFNTTLEIASDI